MRKIKRDTLIFYLNNSDEEIELTDILQWLAGYSGVGIKIEGERIHTWSEINEYASCSLDDNDNDFGLYERIINAKNKNLKEKIRNYEKNKNW